MKRSRLLVLVISMTLFVVGATLSAHAANNGAGEGDGVIVRGPLFKHGPMAKVGRDLANLHKEYKAHVDKEGNDKGFKPSNPLMPVVGNRVVIDAVAVEGADPLKGDLKGLGLQRAASFGRVVSGQLPIGAIKKAAALGSLQSARPSYAMTHGGDVTSQGDQAMRADVARASLGVDGTGVTVGTLSNSYDCQGGAANDVASGDLPEDIVVLAEINFLDCFLFGLGTDEGRGMMQLIHDTAPGAKQAFHSAFNGEADFALGIQELAGCPAGSEPGCIVTPGVKADIIVDDVIYFTEPMFQDGIVAQAVNTVVDSGTSYFSAAGNSGRDGYESLSPLGFNPSGRFPLQKDRHTEAHDFDPGPGVDIFQEITIPKGTTVIFVLQWDQPFYSVSGAPGPTTDLDIHLVDSKKKNSLANGTGNNRISYGGTGEPFEYFVFTNTTEDSGIFNLMIVNWASSTIPAGPNPTALKVVRYGGTSTIQEYDTASGTLFGHANAVRAEAVGAAYYGATPAFGVDPPLLEYFSSAGGTPILLDSAGDTIEPELRQKPEIVAPDGTNTSFFGIDTDGDTFPNFYGTSAAAPHAAAVAALMLDADPSLTPSMIYSTLESTAIDITARNDSSGLGSVTLGDAIFGGIGVDDDSGFGLIQADAAVAALSFARVIITETGPSTYVEEGGVSDTYTLALSSQPTDNVTVTVNPDSQLSTSVVSVAFTTGNWSTPQMVTVTAMDDAVAEGLHTGTITHSASSDDSAYSGGLAIDDVIADISDNDSAGMTLATLTVEEGGATDSYTLVLSSEPIANVIVTVTPDSQLSVSAVELTFTAGNWSTPQPVIVAAVADTFVEGPHTGTITHTASSPDPMYNFELPSVTANITDNAPPPTP